MMRASAIESPCVKICIIDPSTKVCEGCGRTLAEIGAWLSMSPEARRATIRALPARLDALKARR